MYLKDLSEGGLVGSRPSFWVELTRYFPTKAKKEQAPTVTNPADAWDKSDPITLPCQPFIIPKDG